MMAMLGDILAAARDTAGRIEDWLRHADPALAEQAAEAARACNLSLGGYARMAVADFSRYADEEDWATLMSGLRDSADPGIICLAAMVHWRLVAAAACSAHSTPPAQGVAHG